MNNIYHATPYDVSAEGFYFRNHNEYVTQAASHTNEMGLLVEEYQMQYIDGTSATAKLFIALKIDQCSLDVWFRYFEHLSDEDNMKALYLATATNMGIVDIINCLKTVTFNGENNGKAN